MTKPVTTESAKLATPIKEILKSKGFTEERIEKIKNSVENDGKWDFNTVTINDILTNFIVDSSSFADLLCGGLGTVFYDLTSNEDVSDALTEVCLECPVTMNNFIDKQLKGIGLLIKAKSGLIDIDEVAETGEYDNMSPRFRSVYDYVEKLEDGLWKIIKI